MIRKIDFFFHPVIISLFCSLFFTGCRPDSFGGTEMPAGLKAPDFQLIDQRERLFRLSDQKGAVVLLFFGYTFCPDVCPLTLSHWKKVVELLGTSASDVRFVYITVDPERDKPAQLAAHLSVFNDDFIGLTGEPQDLVQVYDDYGVMHEKVQIAESSTGYLVNHTARTQLVDQNGDWRLTFAYGTAPEIIAHDIQLLLKN